MWRNLLAKYGNRVKTNELDDRISFILDDLSVIQKNNWVVRASFYFYFTHLYFHLDTNSTN